MILDTLKLLFAPGDVVEMRIPRANRDRTFSGYFSDFEKLADAASKYNGNVPSIYVTLNPVKPELLARAHNRINTENSIATQDRDVTKRVWLPVDIDPVRPAGISSNEEEHKAAIAKAYYVQEYLTKRGWPEAVIGDSGNGSSVLYRIELQNTDESTELVKKCLEAFDYIFSDDRIQIDTSVYNASRIWKLYETVAKKGDNTPERPHRQSAILEKPKEVSKVSVDQIKEIISLLPKEPEEPNNKALANGFDIESWMQQYDIPHAHKKTWNGGTMYQLEQCPFDSNHKYPDSSIIRMKSGALVFHCFHKSCSSHDWKALRDMKEPGRKQREASHPVKRDPARYRKYHETDLGNARRLVDLLNGDARYSYPLKRWLVWNGNRWAEDKTGRMQRYAKDVVEEILEEALAMDPDDSKRKELANFAFKCESAAAIRNMLELAQSEECIPILPEEMDRDIWLFNVKNGTLDLKTGKLRTHDRNDKITKISPVVYDPAAKRPTWDRFISEIFSDNEELIRYVQKQAGYALTGDTSEEDFSIHYGTGGNGKSKFNDQIAYIIGDYFVKAKVETILNSKSAQSGNAASGDVARLAGARLVTASEPDRGAELKEGLIKDLTGRENITARRLYEEEFSFKPQFKFWLITNHKPTLKGQDRGIWRRIKLVPFEVTIPEDKIDMNLDIKLKEESSGILNWMLEGCLLWQRERMKVPKKVTEATLEYKEEMDIIGSFLRECCVVDDKKLKTPNKWLYNIVYLAWCEISNVNPVSQKTFTAMLQERGYKNKRLETGMTWLHVGLKLHVLETCIQNESTWGGDIHVGMQDMKRFLKTFLYDFSRRNFSEMPTDPTYPTLKPATDSENSSSGNVGNHVAFILHDSKLSQQEKIIDFAKSVTESSQQELIQCVRNELIAQAPHFPEGINEHLVAAQAYRWQTTEGRITATITYLIRQEDIRVTQEKSGIRYIKWAGW